MAGPAISKFVAEVLANGQGLDSFIAGVHDPDLDLDATQRLGYGGGYDV